MMRLPETKSLVVETNIGVLDQEIMIQTQYNEILGGYA